METQIDHAKNIVEAVTPQLMYQFRKKQWKERMASNLLLLIRSRENEIAQIQETKHSSHYKTVYKNHIQKPKATLGSRFKYFFTGEL